ncbi:MAG: DUF3843 family protein [bacterium]
MLKKAQSSFAYDNLYLRDSQIRELAGVLVEFAEDIHNDIGIWKGYEHYNREFFHTPLPITLRPGVKLEEKELLKHRIHHLIWVWYSILWTGFIFEPEHKDLTLLAGMADDFLEERFTTIPRSSGVKEFLSRPNEYGWDVKKKLIWLGQHSYLFRHSFQNYALEEYAGQVSIPIIDDFVCQENTIWSGLGVIDILAATLDITQKQKSQVRSWYERHLAYYRVLTVKGPGAEVMNLINDKPYTVMVGEPNPFKAGQFIFGSLVPWDKEWYWSGEQKAFPEMPEKLIQEAKDQFFRELSAVSYRYCEDRAQRAREMVSAYYRKFVKYNGDDLVIYPDGASLSADWKKKFPLIYSPDLPARELEKIKMPEIPLSPELEQCTDGIGVYFNPDEGEEIMTGFDDIVSGFEKKGIDLSEDEEEGIIGFMRSDSISPGFVKKMVEKYGDESIASVFYMDRLQHEYYLDYLLRRYKGHFYRNRYPSVSFP